MNIASFLLPKAEVAYLRDDMTLRQGLEKLRRSGFSAIPVIDMEDRYVGVVGVADFVVISPDTDVAVLEEVAAYSDMLLLMSVYPGFGGQKFIEKSLDRMRLLKALRDRVNPHALLEIDGGINLENIDAVRNAGAEVIVAGNTVFAAKDPAKTIQSLRG